MTEMHDGRPPMPASGEEDTFLPPPRLAVETQASPPGENDLHDAAADGDVKKVRAWLDLGADVNAQNVHGNTPLHIAAREGKVDVVRLLRAQNGIDETIENSFGQTPAACAKDGAVKAAFAEPVSKKGLRKVPHKASALDRAGCIFHNMCGGDSLPEDIWDVSMVLVVLIFPLIPVFLYGGIYAAASIFAATAISAYSLAGVSWRFFARHHREIKLVQAIKKEDEKEFSAQLRAGANPNGCGLSFPLHQAVRVGNAEIVRKLLVCGADPNVRDEEGYTPLFRAVQSGSRELADVLRASPDVDLDIPNNEGQTARDFLHMVDGLEGESQTQRFLREFKQEEARVSAKPRMPSPRRKPPQGPELKP